MSATREQFYTAPAATDLPAIPSGVRLVTLPNGLALILCEDHSAPVVNAQAWARSGSINEGRWLGAGLSHVLEHMLFKGTATRPGSRIDQEVQDAGGYMNAYTSFDRTVYHINVPNTGARVAVDILCDIMQNAALPADELAKELDVIRREMDMGQDDPARRAGRRLFETAYTRSPYRYTIIGYPDIFNRITRDDIFAYYREKYVPNNCFFVVVGDINAAEVEQQIRDAYANGKFHAQPPEVLPAEPRQMAAREIIEEAAIELGHLHFSWHIPDLRDPDVPVLDVLAVLLGGGRSSRLYQQVRERKAIVNSVDAWTYSPGSAGLFGMSAVVDAGKFAAARDAMLVEIEKLKQFPVAQEEVEKAVKQFIAGTLSSRKTMQGQAQDLGGSWMAAGDLNFSARYLETVKRLTPADLQRVARQYLTPENRTLYALLPTGASPKQAHTAEVTQTNPIRKFELANGLRLLVKEDHRLPFVEFRAVLQGGVLAETAANCGITQLLTRMLMQGTATRSAEQIATEIESVGGSLDTYGGNNSFGATAEVMREDFAVGLELLADVLLNPSFPAPALEVERAVQLSVLQSKRDQLLALCAQLMRRTMFGDAGYGLESLGSEETLAKFSAADLRAFHQRLVTPGNCVLAIYGDVKAEVVRAAVEKVFGKWPRAASADSALRTPHPALPASRRAEERRDKKQAVVVVGFPGTTFYSADRFAMELLSEACSDLGSRLFIRIRDELGLAYYVGAQNFPGLVPGWFSFYCGTAPEQAALVEAELLKQAESLRTGGITAEELSRAKAKLIGQKKVARQDLSGYAMVTALDELYGLGFATSDAEDAKYEAVTLEQVKAAAEKYLRAENTVIALVRP
ncbi:MAG: insulinase family protein [Verrucomicrobia bacterium]|nr:insulinase family protein [Verrucomicrobiota bacterium]